MATSLKTPMAAVEAEVETPFSVMQNSSTIDGIDNDEDGSSNELSSFFDMLKRAQNRTTQPFPLERVAGSSENLKKAPGMQTVDSVLGNIFSGVCEAAAASLGAKIVYNIEHAKEVKKMQEMTKLRSKVFKVPPRASPTLHAHIMERSLRRHTRQDATSPTIMVSSGSSHNLHGDSVIGILNVSNDGTMRDSISTAGMDLSRRSDNSTGAGGDYVVLEGLQPRRSTLAMESVSSHPSRRSVTVVTPVIDNILPPVMSITHGGVVKYTESATSVVTIDSDSNSPRSAGPLGNISPMDDGDHSGSRRESTAVASVSSAELQADIASMNVEQLYTVFAEQCNVAPLKSVRKMLQQYDFKYILDDDASYDTMMACYEGAASRMREASKPVVDTAISLLGTISRTVSISEGSVANAAASIRSLHLASCTSVDRVVQQSAQQLESKHSDPTLAASRLDEPTAVLQGFSLASRFPFPGVVNLLLLSATTLPDPEESAKDSNVASPKQLNFKTSLPLQRVESLDFSHCCLGPQGVQPILELLNYVPMLQHLSLKDCRLDDAAVALLTFIAKHQLPYLHIIDLRGNPKITFEGGRALQKLASEHKSIISIMLDGTSTRPSTRRSVDTLCSHRLVRELGAFGSGGTDYFSPDLRSQSAGDSEAEKSVTLSLPQTPTTTM